MRRVPRVLGDLGSVGGLGFSRRSIQVWGFLGNGLKLKGPGLRILAIDFGQMSCRSLKVLVEECLQQGRID